MEQADQPVPSQTLQMSWEKFSLPNLIDARIVETQTPQGYLIIGGFNKKEASYNSSPYFLQKGKDPSSVHTFSSLPFGVSIAAISLRKSHQSRCQIYIGGGITTKGPTTSFYSFPEATLADLQLHYVTLFLIISKHQLVFCLDLNLFLLLRNQSRLCLSLGIPISFFHMKKKSIFMVG